MIILSYDARGLPTTGITRKIFTLTPFAFVSSKRRNRPSRKLGNAPLPSIPPRYLARPLSATDRAHKPKRPTLPSRHTRPPRMFRLPPYIHTYAVHTEMRLWSPIAYPDFFSRHLIVLLRPAYRGPPPVPHGKRLNRDGRTHSHLRSQIRKKSNGLSSYGPLTGTGYHAAPCRLDLPGALDISSFFCYRYPQ